VHDRDREKPVYFSWQILDWPVPFDVQQRIRLSFERVQFVVEHVQPSIGLRPLQLTYVERPFESRARNGAHTRAYVARSNRDYAAQDAKNRSLGLAGEIAAVESEKKSLIDAGRQDLAKRVIHVAQIEGDGAGYDVRSFTSDGHQQFIEVKATRGDAKTSFYATANEVRFSVDHEDDYYLYRIFDFDEKTGAKVFVERGPLDRAFALTAIQFRAESTGRNSDTGAMKKV
jgi:Protein NO VEIN, C-terminal